MELPGGALAPARPSRSRMVVVALVQVTCVALVAHTLWQHREELTSVPYVSVGPVVVLLALNAIGHLQRTLEFTYMLRRLGVREPFGEGFLLTGAGYLLNHLPLNAGFVVRAIVLHRDHSLPYSSYVSLTLVNAVVNVGVGALVAALVLASGGTHSGSKSALVIALIAIALLSLCMLYMPVMSFSRASSWVGRQLSSLGQGVTLIRGSGGALLLLMALALTKMFAFTLRFAVCWYVLGQPISVRAVLLMGVAQNLLALVNVTPGNLGLRELVVSVLSGELGSSRTIGLAAASIERVVNLLYIVAVGLPGIHSLRNRGRASQPS
jgi:uncharacterized membrane protein YbhN (UPF0104 family)